MEKTKLKSKLNTETTEKLTKDTLVFDVDGVLINWLSQLPLFCLRKGINQKTVLEQYTSPHHLTPCELFGIKNEDRAIELLELYNLEHGKYMTAYTDAVIHIAELAKTYNLVALTKFGKTIHHHNVRKYNLETFFPDCFSELICTGFDESKSVYMHKIIRDHGKVVGFIDDQLFNIDNIKSHFPDITTIHLNCNDKNAQTDTIGDVTKFLNKE